MYYPRGDRWSELRRLINTSFLRGTLPRKSNLPLDMVFSFLPGYIGFAIEPAKYAAIERLHTLHFELASSLTGYENCGMAKYVKIEKLN